MRNSRFGADIFAEGDSVNPMDGVANLADIMLVLACGLMLALVINWNVKISNEDIAASDDSPAEATYEEIEPTEGSESGEVNSDGYMEVGVVYRDPETGKLYLVANDGSVAPDELQVED